MWTGLRPTATVTVSDLKAALHRITSAPCQALLACVAACIAAWAPSALAADGPGIYTCTDAQGRRLTSDRPIAECAARDQRQLNKDGSLRRVVPPAMSPEERAEREAAERRLALQKSAQLDAVRRDRNLIGRYPDEAAHRKARQAALDTVRAAIKTTELRVKELATERKPLLDETEFYKGRQLPARLKQQLDANDAAVEAQRASAANQEAELVRINRIYDLELERLRRLWAGAAPGSLGPVDLLQGTEVTGNPSPLRNASQH